MKDEKQPLKAEGKGAKRPLSEAPIQEYAITVKPTSKENKQKVSTNDLFLLEFYIGLCNKHNMVRLVSIKELDSLGLPHIHGTVLCSKLPYLKAYGWHIHIVKKTTSHWEDYLQKQFREIKKDQRNLSLYYQKSYGFVDNKHVSPFILKL